MGVIHNFNRQIMSNGATISLWRFAKEHWHDGRVAVDRSIGYVARKIELRNVPIEDDKVMFMTFNNAYQCNPRYVLEELVRRKSKCHLVWAINRNGKTDISQIPPGVEIVRRGTYEFYLALASSRVWVDNALNCLWTPSPKREGQVYINTWHGSMGLKRIGPDTVVDPYWLKAADRVSKAVDYMISDSTFETVVYRTTYFRDANILEYGHPRNDMLVMQDDEFKEKLRGKIAKQYGFNSNDKLLLYAPTFRDDETENPDNYDVDFDSAVQALEKRFGGTWRVLSRRHFHNRSMRLNNRYNELDRVTDVTNYGNMQELLLIADAGLTDYSSWCCDYVLTGRPCFLFVPDYEVYKKGRGLYYNLEDTPFPLAFNNGQLRDQILDFNEDAYQEESTVFLNALGCREDGHASERVADLIEKSIKEGKASK